MRFCTLFCILGPLAFQSAAQSVVPVKPSFSDVVTWESLGDLTPSVNSGAIAVQAGRVRFGTEVCTNFTSASTVSITSGAAAGIAKLYVSDSCAIVLEYPNTLKLTLELKNITAAAVDSPSVPVTALYLADVNIDDRGFASVTDKRSILVAFSAMAGSGIVIDCTAGPCLFSIDPAVVATLGGTDAATGVIDNRRAAQTFPSRVAASDPPTCIIAQQYFNTTANVRKDCTAANTWTTPGASGNSSTLYQKIDSQAGFTTAVSSTTPRVVSTSIPSIGAGQCVQWSWTGWASAPGLKVAVAYGTASLSIPGDPGNGATITGTICNNRTVQNAQTLSASSSPGMALQHTAVNVNAATAQNLTLTMTGETSVTTQLWTVSQVN